MSKIEHSHNASATLAATVKRSSEIEADLTSNPTGYRVLTGDRPTGSLHVGHLFGSLLNRVRLQKLGVETFVVIADYQVLTDRDTLGEVSQNVNELMLDYLAIGLDPFTKPTFIFPHSYIPALNQLLLPFLTLVSMSELDRNPTVKEEIRSANLRTVHAAMYMYPLHQTADILFCKGNLVPVGKDQLPHLELARKVAQRFNDRYTSLEPIFSEPDALLSDSSLILGLDGSQKMSKSRNNAVFLKNTPDETAALIRSAKTDSDRTITYDPIVRPEVSNLLKILSNMTGMTPQEHAERIGHGGASKLKQEVITTLNEYLAPMRARRIEFAQDKLIVKEALERGIQKANQEANRTMEQVRRAMSMEYL